MLKLLLQQQIPCTPERPGLALLAMVEACPADFTYSYSS